MTPDLDLLAGLVEQGEGACVAADDFAGPHGAAVRHWQDLGFLPREGSADPAPGCPNCGEGVPYPVGGRVICNACHSAVDPGQLLLWAFDPGAFLRWFAGEAKLQGGVRQLDAATWQLGTWADGPDRTECFFRGRGTPTPPARARLAAYRDVLVLLGRTRPPDPVPPAARHLSLVDVLRQDGRLSVVPLADVFRPRGNVRFDAHTGALWVGDRWLGEVTPGGREYHFFARLAADLDHFVPYRELKRAVLGQTGGSDGTDEATFCQNLKRRAKKAVPEIDRLIATTNKGDGYRLRGHAGG